MLDRLPVSRVKEVVVVSWVSSCAGMTEAGAGRVAMVVMVSADDDEGESSQVGLGDSWGMAGLLDDQSRPW